MNFDLVNLFHLQCKNRPSKDDIAAGKLKPNMIIRRWCSNSDHSRDPKQMCFNISHLGIIMSETDFSKSLLHLIQFHHSTKLADTEFHEFTKLLYRYFANTTNSFADEFVQLVRNRLCPDSSQLTQNFKNMSLDQSLVGQCCFIAIRDSKKDKKQILKKIRYGVSKYFRKEVHRAKPNALKWNCDEQNQITNRSQLYCCNPDHMLAYSDNRLSVSEIIPRIRLIFSEFLQNRQASPTRLPSTSNFPKCIKFAEIEYYRFTQFYNSEERKNWVETFNSYYCNHKAIDKTAAKWLNHDIKPWSRVRIRPMLNQAHKGTNKVDQEPYPIIEKDASFNLLFKKKSDGLRCRDLFENGDKGHSKCKEQERLYASTCLQSYTSKSNRSKLICGRDHSKYEFNVCLDHAYGKFLNKRSKSIDPDLVISVENVGSEPIYCSCSPAEYDEINSWLIENNRKVQNFGTLFKQMKKHSRLKCFKFNSDIEEDWRNKTKNMNSDQLQEALKHFASFNIMVAWNFHPETREPILKFEDLKAPPEILDRLGLEPNSIFILTEGDSKRTEYFNVLVTPVLNELEQDMTERHNKEKPKPCSN